MRQKIVAGNWKMNKTLQEAQELTSEVAAMAQDEVDSRVQLILAPPAVFLHRLYSMIQQSAVAFSAQNSAIELQGAFTGELSAPMLRSVGASYTILGHSERRQWFGETSQIVSRKAQLALASGLKVIVCCGEPLEVRQQQQHLPYVTNQLTESVQGISESDRSSVIVAYEPVWAIGTGHTALPEQVQEMHSTIRTHISSFWGTDDSASLPILYGGSCNASNAPMLFALPDVDGGLIGGASLQARSFIDVAKSFTW